jgi:integrase
VVSKRGSGEGSIYEEIPGKWVASITTGYEVGDDGKRRRVRKRFTASTRGGVQDKLKEGLDKQRRGINVAPEKITLGAFLQSWLEHTVKPSVRPKTYRSYEQMVRNHLSKTVPPALWKKNKLDNIPGLGALKPQALTLPVLEQFFNAKMAAGNSPNLIRYLRTVLRIALNEARRQDLIEKNVAELSRPPRVPEPDISPLGTDEAHRLLAAVKGHRLEALFTVALAIGLRHGEALALQWSEIDLNAGRLQIRHTLQRVDGKLQRVEPKSRDSRREVPLIGMCVDALRAHCVRQNMERIMAGTRWVETGYVFTSGIGTPLIDRNVLRDFHALLQVANLGRRRFHDLRHGCVSLLAAQGVDIKTIAEIVGHSDVRLTRNVYLHTTQATRRAGLEKVGDFLLAPYLAPHEAKSKSPSRPN